MKPVKTKFKMWVIVQKTTQDNKVELEPIIAWGDRKSAEMDKENMKYVEFKHPHYRRKLIIKNVEVDLSWGMIYDKTRQDNC